MTDGSGPPGWCELLTAEPPYGVANISDGIATLFVQQVMFNAYTTLGLASFAAKRKAAQYYLTILLGMFSES